MQSTTENQRKETAPKTIRRTTGGLILFAAIAASGGILAAGLQMAPQPARAEAVSLPAPQTTGFADVVEAVSPAVVSVKTTGTLEANLQEPGPGFPRVLREHPFFRNHPLLREFQKDYAREPRSPRRHRHASQGSGFFISDDGYLVTNHHVIENGDEFVVVMHDGTEIEAELVGADAKTDLAVLKAESDGKFDYVRFSEGSPRVGDWVVAVGNPFGLGGTVTAGIVSAHERALTSNDDFLQIDAAINRGNSGGPTFDLKGEVVGINTAIMSPSGTNMGIAFAIPASTASEIVDDLIRDGSVVRGWLGVRIQPVTDDIADSLGMSETEGVMVVAPQQDSPAAEADIRARDVILSVDGEAVDSTRELSRRIASYQPGSEVEIALWRDEAQEIITAKLGRLAEDAEALPTVREEEKSRKLRLGISIQADQNGNVAIANVEPESLAEEKGMQPGDVIVSIDGVEISDPVDAVRILRKSQKAGKKAALFEIERNGQAQFVGLPLRRS